MSDSDTLAASPEGGTAGPWWRDCPDRKKPHVHMPNWNAGSSHGMLLTALADVDTGLEIPRSRR